MIERLNSETGNVKPAKEVLQLTRQLKEQGTKITVAEVGIGWGATSVELIKLLSREDEYYFFDFEDEVKELNDDLSKINKNHVKLKPIGNSHKTLDSYTWNLAKLFIDWKEKYGAAQRFDLVYLDGAHTFIHDGGTACLLKEMIRRGGILVLDDIDWSLAKSPTCNPQVNPGILDAYTLEQIETCQIAMVRKCFLDFDSRFENIDPDNKRRAIFRRI